MPCGRAFDARGHSAPSGLRPDNRSEPVRREVLVVLGRGPPPAPAPTDPPEGPDDDVATHDHPRADVRSVDVPAAPAGRNVRAVDERVLDRVDIDGAAVGVLGPGGGPC